MNVNELWDNLINGGYFTEEELELVTNINGYSLETLEDAIYARHGVRDWDQLQEEHA